MIIVYDTETSGLPLPDGAPLESQPRIIEFAAIKTDDDFNELDRTTFLINPRMQISDIITKITGLTNRDLDDQQTFSYFYNQLCGFFLGCDTIIAHNLSFDLSLLKFELSRIGQQFAFPYPYKQVCTVEKTMHIKGYRLNLSKMHEHLVGEPHVNGAHRAMADVEALLRCCKKLREQQII